ncbi:hypothetical protein CDCA_CDCA02G0574 [Cyanidium caldarium]|uniref:phosphoglucomutase (alpha-D-glucose-1,6-bisphosphate-dependent) n=1 Tax=Cyanidium caldarium TaxID=2771 RepID=A0AAV9IQM2_CYACA|nr:hypothetical protein CDCA_CDCA02G0574 [Cyanidium caldarium]
MGDAAGSFVIKQFGVKPFEGQKMGTSGLRKKVKVFQQPGYIEAFVQSIFDALPEIPGSGMDGRAQSAPVLVLGGDGRYFNREAIRTITRLVAANGVGKLLIGQNGILCTPAVSAIIRARRLSGGIILTASHNPGGPNADFGIKYNTGDGGPAPESYTDVFYAKSQRVSGYRSACTESDADPFASVNLSRRGSYTFVDRTAATERRFVIEVIDSADDYVALFRSIFDFERLRALLRRPDFSMLFDSLHGVTGAYTRRIFCEELGAPPSALRNATPLEDFGGGHPDPNLVYAAELVALCDPKQNPKAPEFGAASDGDGDRNMIIGRGFFVTPNDSLAVIAAYAERAIPYFAGGKLVGVARSMPTASSVDRVAAKHGLACYETPTGWKFFSSLLSSGRAQICGEESFGTSSDHVREKDGIWAVLCWLSVLAYRNVDKTPVGSLVGVQQVVEEHWREYGRNFFTRYDYEECDADAAHAMMQHLEEYQRRGDMSLLERGYGDKVSVADNFCYTDPVDGSVARNQGIRFVFADGSRIVFRLSGTGSMGATIRMYIEKYESDPSRVDQDAATALRGLVQLALEVSKLPSFTGRDRPNVIT